MNPLWTSRSVWVSGDRVRALEDLLDALREGLGLPVGLPNLRSRVKRLPSPYLQAVLQVTADREWMLRSFTEVFPVLWGWSPLDLWLIGLKLYAHPDAPPSAEDAVVELLMDSRRAGWLGSDPAESPNGGRAVLSDDMIKSFVSPSLREKLAASLGSYGLAPTPGSWQLVVAREPDIFLERFLEWNFIVWSQDLEEFVLRWDVIRYAFPEYAAVARDVVGASLPGLTDERASELVGLHAGRPCCCDASAWLSELAVGLSQDDFDSLRMIENA